MKYFLSLNIVLILSIGNFVPFFKDDLITLTTKLTLFFINSLLIVVFFNKNYINKTIIIYTFLITFIFLLSSLGSYDLVYALDKYFSNSLCIFYLIILYSITFYKYGFDDLIKSIVFCGIFILVLTFFYKVNFGFWNRQIRFFINGSIVFAWLMGFYSILSLYLYKKFDKNIYFIFACIFFLGVLWAESKGPLIAMIISILFYLMYDSKRYIQFIAFSVLIFLIYIWDTVLLYLNVIFESSRFSALIRVLSNDVSSQDSGSITVRQDMLYEGYGFILNNVWKGVGVGNYQFNTVYGFIYPHNIHLEVFIEFGIIIGILYFIFILTCFFKSPKIIKTLIIFFLICGSFSGDITYLRFLMFLCLVGFMYKSMAKNKYGILSRNL